MIRMSKIPGLLPFCAGFFTAFSGIEVYRGEYLSGLILFFVGFWLGLVSVHVKGRKRSMSIDSVIVGISILRKDDTVSLTLEPREDKHLSSSRMFITNVPPEEEKFLPNLLGCEVWGSSSDLYIGDKKFATRTTSCDLALVLGWQMAVNEWRLKRDLPIA